MVRKSLRSPREDSYYKKKGGDDDDFSIMTSDFASKAAITNNNASSQAAATSASQDTATADAQKQYDAFMSGLDDRQKNAIKVLDTWFQLKSSCVDQMTEMEAGNDALRDAVSRSKSARALATNLPEKELGMKLGIGAASISYSDGSGKATDVEVKAFQKKITSLESELVEVRTELDRERSKSKKLKDASSTALKSRKKDIESLKSKLRYYKKENEALTQKVILYKEALEEANNSDAAATVPAPSVDSCEETVAASNMQTKEEIANNEKEQDGPRSSPMRYDRKVLRKKMKCAASSPIKEASGRANEEKLIEDAKLTENIEEAAPEEREIIEVNNVDHVDDTRDASEEEEEVAQDAEPAVQEDADLTFSEMMALNMPAVTQAPKLRPKFKVGSSGAFGSAPAIATSKTKVSEAKVTDVVEEKTEDVHEAEDTLIDNDEAKPSAFAMAMKNFSNGSSNKPTGFKKSAPRTAPPSVPALDDTKTSTEKSDEEKTTTVSSAAKEEAAKVEVSEEQAANSSLAKSKIASLAESYGSSIRAKRMSFERPPPTAPTSLKKEPEPVPVKEDISADVAPVVEDAVVTDSRAGADNDIVTDVDASEVSTPSKVPVPATAASSNVGPGSAQKELEALRSMLKGRGGMANKKRFEMFEKKAE